MLRSVILFLFVSLVCTMALVLPVPIRGGRKENLKIKFNRESNHNTTICMNNPTCTPDAMKRLSKTYKKRFASLPNSTTTNPNGQVCSQNNDLTHPQQLFINILLQSHMLGSTQSSAELRTNLTSVELIETLPYVSTNTVTYLLLTRTKNFRGPYKITDLIKLFLF
jgi:hypothetical protein